MSEMYKAADKLDEVALGAEAHQDDTMVPRRMMLLPRQASGARGAWAEPTDADPDERALLASLCEELGGRVEVSEIKKAIAEARAKYKKAKVQTFVPILIRRYVLTRLR